MDGTQGAPAGPKAAPELQSPAGGGGARARSPAGNKEEPGWGRALPVSGDRSQGKPLACRTPEEEQPPRGWRGRVGEVAGP